MRAYYSDDHVTLYHGDCRDITAWLDADVLVTDPPYGRNWRQGEIKGHASPNLRRGIAFDLSTAVRDEALALWGDRPAVTFGDLMLPPPPGTKQVLVYAKPPDAGLRGATAKFRRDAEAIYLINTWPSGIGGVSSILRTGARLVGSPSGLSARSGGHPHSKPIDVMSILLERTTGTVADPFAGSGSTLVAAKLLGRRAIGVELEERYCEIAARRLAQDALPFGEAS